MYNTLIIVVFSSDNFGAIFYFPKKYIFLTVYFFVTIFDNGGKKTINRKIPSPPLPVTMVSYQSQLDKGKSVVQIGWARTAESDKDVASSSRSSRRCFVFAQI